MSWLERIVIYGCIAALAALHFGRGNGDGESAPPDDATYRRLTVQELSVVGPGGVRLVHAAADPAGGGAVSVHRDDGQRVARLHGATLRLESPGGKPAVRLGVVAGAARLEMHGGTGVLAAELGSGATGGFLVVRDPTGREAARVAAAKR